MGEILAQKGVTKQKKREPLSSVFFKYSVLEKED
jgi:hypothetical protein